MSELTVLITGAAGFIGGRLAEVLFLRGDVTVRAGIRRWSSAARLARMPLPIIRCDIMEPEEVAAAAEGADVIVHCAYNDQRRVIVEGTANVLAAARDQDVRQVIYLSSTEIYGAAEGTIDEDHPGTPPFSDYAAAKRDAEQLCAAYYAAGLPVTVLRPAIVHGPFSQRTIKFAGRLLSGKWGAFGALGNGRCNLIYIDDVVGAILAALNRPEAFGETFNLVGPEIISWNDYFQRFNAALDQPPLGDYSPRQSTARSLMRDGAHRVSRQARALWGEQLMALYQRDGVASQAMKWVKNALFTTPTTRELRSQYNRDAHYVATRITDRLGFAPQVHVDTGLALCAAWLAHHGFLPESQSVRPPSPNGVATEGEAPTR